MKQIILGAVLVCFTISSSGQNSSVSIKNPSPESLDNRWDINNYLWSNIPSSSSDKQILDFDGIENWRNIGRGGEVVSINCNGKYFAYNEYKSWAKDSLVVQSTTGFWRKCFAGAAQGFFSGAGDQYIFQNKDSLCFLKMGDETPHIVPGVVSYKMPLAQKPNWIAYGLRDQTVILQNLLDGMKHSLKDVISYDFEADGRKFVYQVNNPQKELVIYDVITGNESRHSNVKKYKFDAAGKALVLYVTKGASEELQYENISDGYKTMIWFNVDTTINISNYSLDNRGIQLIFTIHENDKNQNSIWYWKKGMDKAIKKLSNQSKGLNEDMAINGDPMFRARLALLTSVMV